MTSPARGQHTWSFAEMPTLGGDESLALGLNDHGDVVGAAQLPDGTRHAALWSGGRIVDLETLGGDASIAYDVNGDGRIVGRATLTDGPFAEAAAFRFDPGDAGLVALDNLTDSFNGMARTVNEAGLVAGFSGSFDTLAAVLWSKTGAVAALAPLPSPLVEPLWDVWDGNEHGDLVGQSTRLDPATGFVGFGAALWRKGELPEFLGTLGGSGSFARAINDARQVVGFASLADGQLHAFLWDDGAMTDLGDLAPPGQVTFSVAHDIDPNGRVVGASVDGSSELRAFVWDGGTINDLNDSSGLPAGWVLEEAFGVNTHGQIVGRARTPEGHERGFLLTPDQVPAALPLVASPGSVSLSAGGSQLLTVQGGLPNAGELYLVLGSASGTAPGLPLGPSWTLPVAPDAYTTFTFKKANRGPFTSTFGLLDETGRAAAAFTLPPSTDPDLAGISMNHAFAVFDAATVTPLFASNPTTVTLVP